MKGRLALAAAVLAAMALGRVITDQFPVGEVSSEPFVRHGKLGSTVSLSYADVTATRVRSSAGLEGSAPVRAAGTFLLVDLTFLATREDTRFLGVELRDRTGRRFAPTTRGATCPESTLAPAGVPWYAVFCFDVPRDALSGMTLQVARGDYAVNGSGQRRDDQALIDLRIDAKQQRSLATSMAIYRAAFPGLTPVEFVRLKEPS